MDVGQTVGTIGGGIRMNSGCFNKEFKDTLISIQIIDFKGIVKSIPANKINFNKSYLASIRKPFFAYQSCLIDSGEFQFQNSSTNFKQEIYMMPSMSSECLE